MRAPDECNSILPTTLTAQCVCPRRQRRGGALRECPNIVWQKKVRGAEGAMKQERFLINDERLFSACYAQGCNSFHNSNILINKWSSGLWVNAARNGDL